ncbi:putative integral membrane protein, partial [Campylobacter jejuni subsp. jejuni 1997-10]
KYELYCKEIELKQNWDKKGENVKNTTDLEKNVSRIRDFMDFLLLGFYRKLCDHHTDFLKVFNNLILLIALYALFVSLYICLVYTKSLFFGRYVVLIFSYIVFIIMPIKQPNVIHPLIGKIANESDKFFNYPSLIVLNILYTILLALVLFSLQKTARK